MTDKPTPSQPETASEAYASSRNACKACTPLGASVAYKGVRGCVPLLHGSQGCSTYIRRYLISHYKEPIDIASTNFGPDTAIFGGKTNFFTALDNIIQQYNPEVVAIATTCVSETIGEDVNMLIAEYKAQRPGPLPGLVYCATPSYNGTHIDGFHEAVSSLVQAFAAPSPKTDDITLIPGFVSPEDIRQLRHIAEAFGLKSIILPDYSDTLDSGNWEQYVRISPGGTGIEDISRLPGTRMVIELGQVFNRAAGSQRARGQRPVPTAGQWLEQKWGVPCSQIPLPIGIAATDKLAQIFADLSGKEMPALMQGERSRLIDAYIDGHKYVFGKRAILYGEEDFVLGMAAFLAEIGIQTVYAGSGGESSSFMELLKEASGNPDLAVGSGSDFEHIRSMAHQLKPDFLIGNSKGYYIARELGIPLVRVGFPIHDRMGGQRLLHVGYRGAQQLFDLIANTLIQAKQDNSPVGYKYM